MFESSVLYVQPDGAGVAGLTGGEQSVTVEEIHALTDLRARLEEFDPDVFVCEYTLPGRETGLDVLARVRKLRPDLPFILCTDGPDAEVASEATRLGVTEYYPRGMDGDSLSDRIRAQLDEQRGPTASAGAGDLVRYTGAERDSDRTPLQRLYQITSSKELSFDEKLTQLLDLVRRRLGLSIGFLTRVENGQLTIVEAVGDDSLPGHESPLEEVYCRETVEAADLVRYPDLVGAGWGDDIAHEKYGLGCYLGGRIEVDDELYGTLCFGDEAAREVEFSPAEETFVELVAEWLSYELERRDREQQLHAANECIENSFERIDDGFFAIDTDWQLTYFNSTAEDVLGMDRESVLGENVWEVFPEAIEQAFYDEYHEVMATQEPTHFEEYFPPLDAWFSVSAYPSEDGLSVYFRDVTERKERETKVTSLLETTRALMDAGDPETVAETVVEAARDVLGFELNLVRLYDADRDVLEPVTGTDATFEVLGERPVYEPGEGVPGEVFETGELRHYSHKDDLSVEMAGLAEIVCLPLGDHGTLSLSARDLEQFDESDRQIAEILAANATTALDRAAREQELTHHETVMETVQHMVYVLDSDGRFSLVTRPFAERLGYDREALLGRRATEVFAAGETARFADATRLLSDDTTSTSRELETELVTASGDRFPAAVEISLMPGDGFEGSVGVVQDLTELAETRAELDSERDRFSHFFSSIPDAAVDIEIVDGEPLIRSTNPAFESVFGYPAETVRGESLIDLVVPGDARAVDTQLEDGLTEGAVTQLEVRRRTADGERHFLFRGIPYETAGDTTRAFIIYTDITEQKDRQQQLQVLNRVLRHNIRNDLTVVLGQADHLAHQLDDDDDRLALVDRLSEKARDIVDMSNTVRDIESTIGRRVNGHTVDVAAIAREVVAEASETYPEATITADVPDSMVVRGDDQLRLALEHLIENAVEHNDSDHPTVRVVAVTTADGDVQLAVADNGPGVPDNERVVLTDEGDIDQLNHASGLGLWLVRWIAESCHGSLSIEDSRSGGSVVSLELESPPA